MKALYAYFGEIGIFDDDIPGHSFYQVGLLDSISKVFGIDKFDFYNYLDGPADMTTGDTSQYHRPKFPEGQIGQLMNNYSNELIEKYRLSYDQVWAEISHKTYSKLFFKARFRNLSTLSKKLKDTYRFETLIQHALSVGYLPSEIIVLDTDLSLSDTFKNRLDEIGIEVMIPSIHFPGVSKNFLNECLDIHANQLTKEANIIFYGNLDFMNYKSGHHKNPIIFDIINEVEHQFMFDQRIFRMTLATKDTSSIRECTKGMNLVTVIPRTDRAKIWQHLCNSIVSINVSKDLYLDRGFIPARIYESIIAGVIPVCYKSGFHPAMTFNSVDEFYEICKFLIDCSPADYQKILYSIASTL